MNFIKNFYMIVNGRLNRRQKLPTSDLNIAGALLLQPKWTPLITVWVVCVLSKCFVWFPVTLVWVF